MSTTPTTDQMVTDLTDRLTREIAMHTEPNDFTSDQLGAMSRRLIDSLLTAQQSIYRLLVDLTDTSDDDDTTAYGRLRQITDSSMRASSNTLPGHITSVMVTAAQIVALMEAATA